MSQFLRLDVHLSTVYNNEDCSHCFKLTGGLGLGRLISDFNKLVSVDCDHSTRFSILSYFLLGNRTVERSLSPFVQRQLKFQDRWFDRLSRAGNRFDCVCVWLPLCILECAISLFVN